MKYLILFVFGLAASLSGDEGFTKKVGEYTFYSTGFKDNPNVVVHYAIPLKNGKLLVPNASNIIFCAPFVGETVFLNREFHNYFVKELGCTVFSFEFKYKDLLTADRKNWYYYKDSGWHDLVFRIQERLVFDYGLEKRKLIIVGESGGASMGQQIGAYFPEKVDAVCGIGGSLYDIPKKKSEVAWFMLNTWGDETTEKNDEFAQDAAVNGMQVLRLLTPPEFNNKGNSLFHHIPSKMAEDFVFNFVSSIINLRRINAGKLPSFEKWPAKSIIGGKPIYFPSEDFQKRWEEMNSFVMRVNNSAQSEDVLEFTSKESKKIVLFLQDNKFTSATMLDNIYYLIQQGFDVVSISLEMDPFEIRKKRIVNALNRAIEKSKVEKKELLVVGFWQTGYTLLTEVGKLEDTGIGKIYIFNPEKNLFSEKIEVLQNNIECKAFYSQDYWDEKPITNKSWCDEKILKVNNDFGDDWFDFLEKLINPDKKEYE